MMKERGVVVTVVLFFLAAIMLMVAVSWRMIELQWQINHNRYQQLAICQAAEMALKQADNDLKTGDVHCQQPWQPRALIVTRGSDWWHSSACCHRQFNGMVSDYYLVPLQVDPCARLAGKASRYWQLTARAANSQQTAIIRQATVVMPQTSIQTCQGQQRMLHHHWQSWRALQ
ncbi:MAG: hypothetical protein GY821_14080 [Gammaproteobacteria bacterium]|nr:hypothetical protein [Gammaproteobacteria bacterium]